MIVSCTKQIADICEDMKIDCTKQIADVSRCTKQTRITYKTAAIDTDLLSLALLVRHEHLQYVAFLQILSRHDHRHFDDISCADTTTQPTVDLV